MSLKSKCQQKGLTLIELMVSVLIIALLTTVGVVVMKNARAKARDAKRVYDLQQYAKALKLYAQASASGSYPDGAGYLGKNHLGEDVNGKLKEYIPDLPSDPKDPGGEETGNYFYYYIPDNNCSGGTYPTVHALNIETSNPEYHNNECSDGSEQNGANDADYLIIVR